MEIYEFRFAHVEFEVPILLSQEGHRVVQVGTCYESKQVFEDGVKKLSIY